MKQPKHKKLLVVSIGITAALVIAAYLWVGAFVLQVFPRNDPQDPGSVASAQKFSGELTGTHNHDTLAQVDEKKVSAPTSNHIASNAAQPTNHSEKQETQNVDKPTRGKRHGLLQLLGADL